MFIFLSYSSSDFCSPFAGLSLVTLILGFLAYGLVFLLFLTNFLGLSFSLRSSNPSSEFLVLPLRFVVTRLTLCNVIHLV